MSINSILSLAANALQTEQQAIQTTGNNLANISTPGYSRERVNLVSAAPAFEGGVLIGSGVNAAGVQRVVDGFTEAQLLTLNGNVGYSQAENQALASVQGVFPTSGGIDAALSAFFGSLSDLANNPSDPATRESVIGQATTETSRFRRARRAVSRLIFREAKCSKERA